MFKLALALALTLLASAANADTLISNINGIQVGADGKLQHFTGLLIGHDGKVTRTLGPADDVGVKGVVVDGGGRILLPGLVDAHGHVTQLGLITMQVDLSGVASIDELKQRVARFAVEHPGTAWIQGRGWNQELWSDKRMPSAADIDAVVPGRPLWLYRVDGHAAVANSAAMRAVGIKRETPTPKGGAIGRDASGNPNGLFTDTARELVESKMPPMSEAEVDTAILAAQQILLSNGITSVAHMRTSAEDWAAMNRVGQRGALKVRIMAYAFGLDALRKAGVSRPTGWLHADHLEMRGVKFYDDGALGSRGAWLKQPYADAPDTRGLSLHSDAELIQEAGQAARNGFQVAVHAIGDAANAQAISVYETLGKTYGRNRRWRIEHVQVMDPSDIPRLASAGIVASMQPVHQVSDRLMADERLGPERLRGAYAWQSIARSGAKLAFGSDFPFDTPSPFRGLSAAISRQDMDGQPPGGWMSSERVTIEQALTAYTRGAAYAGFAEDRIGALEPGKWADFILIDRDPTKVDPQSLARTQVLETWVAGKKVWQLPSGAGPAERGK